MKSSYETPYYHMALWAHKTYILDNLPTGIVNKSMPKDMFRFGSPSGFAKNFVSTYKGSMDVEGENEQDKDEFGKRIIWNQVLNPNKGN